MCFSLCFNYINSFANRKLILLLTTQGFQYSNTGSANNLMFCRISECKINPTDMAD